MKCVMVMFDSLNRHMLPPYDAGTWVHAPNFARLAQRSATFDTSYVCSMPCMPARRDFHTGRPNFLQANWGPLEPFDDSVPQMLKEAGVYTHLCTDHYHYWEDGGATYHNRYNSYELARGQEGDHWIGQVADPTPPPSLKIQHRRHDWVNRIHLTREDDHPQSVTFAHGLDFIERNHRDDRWFLQIECFDPHEPFFTHRKYRDLYPPDAPDAPLFDWPSYGRVQETPEQVESARRHYAALVSKCDASLGDVLDAFDRHSLWDDTMLVVWTDHGFLLGEHGWWAKNQPPMYEEISHTPFFVWDPRKPGAAGQRRKALVQPSIDLGPTLLNYFGLQPTPDMLGHDLAGVMRDDSPVREWALFGYHGSRVNITDGRHTYYRATDTTLPAYTYTLMPTSMRGFKGHLKDATLHPPLHHTKGLPVLKIKANTFNQGLTPGEESHLLFDLSSDPMQQHPLDDAGLEQRCCDAMVSMMAKYAAPAEAYERVGLEPAQV